MRPEPPRLEHRFHLARTEPKAPALRAAETEPRQLASLTPIDDRRRRQAKLIGEFRSRQQALAHAATSTSAVISS
jgi:hypothetical protein